MMGKSWPGKVKVGKKKKRRRKIKNNTVHPHTQHARQRFLERLGIRLTRELEKKIIKVIRKRGQQLRSRAYSNSRRLFEVPVDENTFYVIYSRSTGKLVTCYEPEWGMNALEEE